LVLGTWLLVSPWFLGFSASAIGLNTLVIAIFIIVCSGSALSEVTGGMAKAGFPQPVVHSAIPGLLDGLPSQPSESQTRTPKSLRACVTDLGSLIRYAGKIFEPS
jgi:hypothetical protein